MMYGAIPSRRAMDPVAVDYRPFSTGYALDHHSTIPKQGDPRLCDGACWVNGPVMFVAHGTRT